MKKLFFLALAAILIMSTVVASEFPILDRQVEIRAARLAWLNQIQLVGMDAAIEYIDETSNGTGTVKLSSMRDEFSSQAETLQTLTTHAALNEALRGLRNVTTDFRVENRKQMTQHKGKNLVLLARLAEALVEHKDELGAMEDDYWGLREALELEIFDIRINQSEWVLDKLEANGYDVTEAQDKLDEIKAKRADLEDAFGERNNLKLIAVQLEVFGLSKELAIIVKDLQVQVPQQTRARFWTSVGERVLERTGTIISELDSLGVDVSELEAIHSEAETLLEDAKKRFEADDIEGAVESLKGLRDKLLELKEAYLDLISGGSVPPEIVPKVESMKEALGTTLDEMAKEL